MNCPQCGAQVGATDDFCGNCGNYLGWGAKARRIRATVTDETSAIGSDLATAKDEASALLHRAGLPVPDWRIVRSAEEAIAAARRMGHPVVVKPVDGNHGRAVALNLRDDWSVGQAFAAAAAASPRHEAMVQRELRGRDHFRPFRDLGLYRRCEFRRTAADGHRAFLQQMSRYVR